MAVMMPGKRAFQFLLRRAVEPLEGKPGRGEFGFAAIIGNGPSRQNRSERRYALERAVGVPELIGLVAYGITMVGRHDFAVRADGRENDKMRSGAERADLGDFRRT